MKWTSACIIFLLALLCNRIEAQTDQGPAVSGNFDSTLLKDLAAGLQKQSGYRFYYDPVLGDSLRITAAVSNEPLGTALNRILAPAGLKATLYRHTVFLLKGLQLQTALPDNFFTPENKLLAAEPNKDSISSAYLLAFKGSKNKPVEEDKLYVIGERAGRNPHGEVTLAGYVRNVSNGEPVQGASVYLADGSVGTSTDLYGYYAISLPRGRYILQIQGLGMRDTKRRILLQNEGKLDIDLIEQVATLKEVIVSARKTANVRKVQMGVQQLNISTIKQAPALFGEADVLRAVQSLPGVKTVGEASTGLNVRGGSTDQNLILFNGATIYNPSHFFGFFSAFNPELVKEVELYKSSLPARLGGRLSSVLDITSKEGNKKNFKGSAGIGVLTSRFTIEGPIQKNKSSFILGGRTTYANWLLKLLPDEYKRSRASFYDLNLHISHTFNNKNSLYLTGYLSQDNFRLNSDTSYAYRNGNINLRWKHSFNNKFTGVLSAGYDSYAYEIYSDKIPVNAYRLNFSIAQLNASANFTYYVNSAHTLDFGISSIRYSLYPGNYRPLGDSSLVTKNEVEAEQALESAVYISDRLNLSPDLSLEAGIRYSYFNYLGPKQVNQYAPGLPKTEDNQTGTVFYDKGKFIHSYAGPEYRLSARYQLSGSASIKAALTTTRQYIHMLSNTTAISPTDIWKLSDPNIKPQEGEQVSLGFYKNLKSNTIETSVEIYYKRIRNYLDYKSGAQLVLNHHIETDVMGTKGKAYGVELLLRKTAGKLNGWISYTYSRILLKMDDASAGEIINKGAYYPASYDKPHDITVVSNYRFSHRFSISVNATYSTGRPITLPTGSFYYGGSRRVIYTDRNAARIPDYFRTDFSMNIEGNHKVHQKTHNSWTLGLYNVTGRKNPYSVYFVSENGVVNGYKLSIFGSILPYINYNIRF